MSTHNKCFHVEIREKCQHFLVGKNALSQTMVKDLVLNG